MIPRTLTHVRDMFRCFVAIREHDSCITHEHMYFNSVISVMTTTNANERPTIVRTSRIFLLTNLSPPRFLTPDSETFNFKNNDGNYKKRERKKRIKYTKNNDAQCKYLGYVNDPQPGLIQKLYP